MEYQEYVDQKKEIYEHFYQLIINENDSCIEYQRLFQKIEEQKIQEDGEELTLFIRLLLNISNYHHRYPNFYTKIFKILDFLLVSIKRSFKNFEIFDLMKSNQLIILYLIEKQMITIDKRIAREIVKMSSEVNKNYKFFFYPEIKKIVSKEERESIENCINEKNPDIFDEKRHKGENESMISEMIRNDSIEEFIIYQSKTNLSLSSQIKESIFETNSFLNSKESTLIEYAAFFGSIQIVKYLWLNHVELSSSLWLYSIHSNNPELIHFLEENHVKPPNQNYDECLLESIECHHNEISNYIRDQLLCNENDKIVDEMRIEKKIVESCNFREMSVDFNSKFLFYYLCFYGYSKLEKLYIKAKQEKIKNEMINHYFV